MNQEVGIFTIRTSSAQHKGRERFFVDVNETGNRAGFYEVFDTEAEATRYAEIAVALATARKSAQELRDSATYWMNNQAPPDADPLGGVPVVPVAPSPILIGICDGCEIPTDDLHIRLIAGRKLHLCSACLADMERGEDA